MNATSYNWNEATRSYDRKIELFEKQVTARVFFDPEETMYHTLEEFLEQVENRIHWLKAHKNMIDAALLKLYPGWLDDEDDWEENPVSKAEFLSRLTFTGVNFLEDLSFSLFYDDGQTFWGHGIMVDVTADCQISNAGIVG
jgi:hypothetical protein